MRHLSILIVILVLTLAGSTNAQPDSLWSRTYGNEGNDSLRVLIQTSDGGYAAAGYVTDEVGGADCYMMKFDSEVYPVWAKGVGHAYQDDVYDMVQDRQGGFALTGVTSDEPSETRSCFLWQIDPAGDRENWHEYVGDGNNDAGHSIVSLPDGDFAVCGVINPGDEWMDDIMLRKIQPDGSEDWLHNYGDENTSEWGLSMVTVENEETVELVIAVQELVWGDEGVDYGSTVLLKTDEDGNQIWSREFSDEDALSFPLDLIRTRDSGFAMIGGIGYSDQESGITNWNTFLLKTNEEGEQEWMQEYDLDRDEWGMGLIQLGDGGYVFTGALGDQSEANQLENCDCMLVRVNRHGEVIWRETYGGEGLDYGANVIATDDGGYLIGGTTSSIGHGGTDFWLFKTGRDPVSVSSDPSFSVPSTISLLNTYPNPFNSWTTISYYLPVSGFTSLYIYNSTGRRVSTLFEGLRESGTHRVTLDCADNPSGLYIIQLNQSSGINIGGNWDSISREVMLIK